MYYEARRILGVSANAELREIRQAYRQLVKQHHPDAGGDPARFKQINAAYLRLISNQDTPMLEPSVAYEHSIRVVYGSRKPSYSPGYLTVRKVLGPKILWRRGRVSFSIPLLIAIVLPAATWSLHPLATVICSAGFLALGQVKYSKF
ncbi:MAG: DnaJ domain-containing protein [Bacillota bacterium]|nr:DnaJ domain-containing protein [Bacillota bacterium]